MMRRVALCALLFACTVPLAAQFHPNADRGFSAEKIYSFDQIDNVNLFNGNMIATIPLGQRYRVGPNFDYGFVLVYNSNVWDRVTDDLNIHKVPNRRSNAGMGWEVSLGAIISPTDPANETLGGLGLWMFATPDGSHHLMYPDASGTTLYSRDGTYLRMTRVNSRTWKVETADGRMYNFYDFAGNGTNWRLTDISDRTLHTITFDYTVDAGDADTWTVNCQGRRQKLHFASEVGTTYPVKTLQSIDFLTTTGTLASQISLHYQQVDVDPSNTDGTPIHVVMLKDVQLPGGTTYRMGQVPNGPLYYDTSGDTSGVLRRLDLPTGGSLQWDYASVRFPGSSEGRVNVWSSNLGVSVRRLVDADGTVLGAWNYYHYLDTQSKCQVVCANGITCTKGEGRQKVTVVQTPTRDGTTTGARDTAIHYFSVYVADDPCPNDEGWTDAEYGLPFTHYYADTSGRFLSEELHTAVPDADYLPQAGNWRNKGRINEGTLLRSTLVTYEYDAPPSSDDPWNTNRRMKAGSSEINNDNGCGGITCVSKIDHYAWDGHGHYGQTVQQSNFPNSTPRTTFTKYVTNPTSWIWGLATESCTADQVTTAEITSCDALSSPARVMMQVNTSNGQLLGRRTLAGASLGGSDLLTYYVYTSLGEVYTEKHYGGDATEQQLDTTTAFPTPSVSPQYELDHHYDYTTDGAMTKHTATWRDRTTGQPLSFYSADEDYDRNTGLPSATRDTAGVQTDFGYDAR